MARPRAWDTQLINAEFINSGDGFVLGLLDNLIDSDTLTAVRLLIDLKFAPTALDAVLSGSALVDMGIGVASSEAFEAGVTALPDPDVEGDTPARGWLWRNRMFCQYKKESGMFHVYVDSLRADVRSMRKVDRGRLFMRAKALVTDDTFPDCRLVGQVRALCLT